MNEVFPASGARYKPPVVVHVRRPMFVWRDRRSVLPTPNRKETRLENLKPHRARRFPPPLARTGHQLFPR